MEKSRIEEEAEAGSWLFLEVDEDEQGFYRRFVERHGGAFVAMAGPASSFRLDFPPGTRIARNEELDVPVQDSYHIVYPDGARLTWYRVMKLDRRWMYNVLLAPVDDEADWARFTGEQDRAAG